jgi:hypothetical protein
MIDVNKMGWKWGTSDQSKATAERAPSKGGEKPFYVDSRGVVTAWMNTNPNVWILASTTVSSDASILLSANTKRGNPGVTGQNTGYYIVNDSTGNYVLRNGFSYQIDFTLDNVSDDKYSILLILQIKKFIKIEF